MTTIAVWYDPEHPSLYISGIQTPYPPQSLVAKLLSDGVTMEIWIASALTRIVSVPFTWLTDQLGNAFATAAMALAYLDSQFTQSPVAEAETLTFSFSPALSAWSITHNMGKFPLVAIIDSSGNTLQAPVTYTDANNLTIEFSNPVAGSAYLT